MTTPSITPSSGAKYAKLYSVGGYRGSRVVSNEEMCDIIDSTPEWIVQRTGITERRWATEEETPLYMAVQAGRKAIERAGIKPEQVGAIVISTVSHFRQSPSLACYLARELGIPSPAAFDISGACAGFCYATGIGESLVRSGAAEYVLVMGVETLTKLTDFTDRSTAFLFSDGAGAAIIGPSDEPAMGPITWGTDPSQVEVIEINDWDEMDQATTDHPVIQMEGSKVFLWATTFIAEKTKEALESAGLTPEELDVFIPHQANNRITDSMLRHLKLPDSVAVARDIRHMGNSSAASVPLAMEAMLESGQAQSGQTALIIGFGAGLVYAGQVIRLP